MAGCDYLPSVKGIGLKKALNLFDRFLNLDGAVNHLELNRKYM